MKRWLAFDTSTWWAGIALLEAGEDETTAVAEVRLRVRDSHAARLLAAADSTLAMAGWDRRDVDAFAAVRGPGSFTGIRVGLGVLRGLAVSSGKPCVGVDALEAHAEAFGPCPYDRVPLLDASRGEVYGARYDGTSSPPVPLDRPWLGPPDRAAEGRPGEALAFGAGAERYRSLLIGAGLRVAEGPGPAGIAAAAGRIAVRRLQAGEVSDQDLAPMYLRPADAELGRR